MKYVHTNLIAADWKTLSRFYCIVFECQEISPERDLCGDWLDKATGLVGAHIRGAHLRLPGGGENGPTLEMFQYDPVLKGESKAINRPGLAHLAFSVEDVTGTIEKALANGGKMAGEIVTAEIPGAGMIQFAYIQDPEENLVEVQSWLPPNSEAI